MDTSIIAGDVEGLAEEVLQLVHEAEWTPLAVAERAARAVEDNDPVRITVWARVVRDYLAQNP